MAGSTSEAGQPAQVSVFPSTGPCVLFYSVGSVAVACIAAYVAAGHGGRIAVRPLDLGLAVAVFAAAQLARVFHRVSGEAIMLAWGEVGVIAGLCLVPAVWLPVAVAAGTLIGHGARLIGADAVRRSRTLYTMSVISVGGSAAAIIIVIAADPTTPLRVTPTDLTELWPLFLAAGGYYVVTGGLSAAWAAATTAARPITVWRSAARAKRGILLLTVPIGVGVALAASVGPAVLAGLVPFLWLVHVTYAHLVTASAARKTWTALADGLPTLHQLDEPAVAAAALRCAIDVFRPAEAELTWRGQDGPTRRYLSRPELGPESAADPADGTRTALVRLAGPVGHDARRSLTVGGEPMGELHLRFRHPLALQGADAMAFATFADAVASALHDVGTHRKLQDLAARSAFDATHDPLTGLSTRSTLVARGNAEIRRGDLSRPVSLVLLGVDGFRAVNETLSHDAGDELLRLLGRRLADQCRDGEMLGHLGGDEFAVLLLDVVGTPGRADPVVRSRELAASLADPAEVAGVIIAVEASAGVATAEARSAEVSELLRRADVALHAAKRTGSRVARYDAAVAAPGGDRPALLAELRDALATADQIGLHLQPAVDLRTGAAVSAEALARWRHPRRGMLLPDEFIPAMEHSELAGGFTLHVVDMALAVAAGWAQHGITVPVSVNLCARCMVNPELAELVQGRLAKHAVAPPQLILEMSESVLDRDEVLVRSVIEDLRSGGVQVSVDDFGTGSASLSFLTRFAVDEVKIDRSFVAAMAESTETAAIVKTTVDLAADLGLRVVAEGVERADQRDALLDLGVTVAQGFLFHQPVPIDDATAIVSRTAQL